MRALLASKNDPDRGFTLVELLITVLILAILVGIVVMTMTFSRQRAQESTCKANLRVIMGGINSYYANNEEWPDVGTGTPAEKADTLLDILVADGQIKSKPQCPGGGTYEYDDTTHDITCTISSHNP